MALASEARPKIEQRIVKGRQLLERQITAVGDLDALKADAQIWSDFNFQLLTGLFIYAVVLLTPDDEGRPLSDRSAALRPRARQNVVLALGYFVGLLGRECVCALH